VRRNRQAVAYTKEALQKAGVYEEACKMKGYSLETLEAEMLEPPDYLRLSTKEARKLGLTE